MWGVKKPLIGVDMYLPVEWRVFAGTTRRRRREEEEERREGMIIVARPEWLLSCWAQKRFLPLDESRQILLPQHLLDGYVEEEFSPGEALSSSAGRAGSSRSVQHMLSQSQEEEEDQAELEEEEEGLSIQIGGDVAIFNDLPLTHAQRKKILKGNQIQRSQFSSLVSSSVIHKAPFIHLIRQDAKKCCELYLDGSRRWRDLFPDVFAAPVVENDLEETDREM
ncbi:hypothetical protein CSUI_010219 [Cystoisospora suis]|uniref:BRCT domain-containing protein n=1 Tax=Cystoisospora suis TaxID=483139 RepID=A0A2C6KFS2_9APIC|nr:hypothetical protein CSUI_010219 [Cystoisospora suis]